MAIKKASQFPHCLRAARYSREVVAGKIAACKWVRLACQRQINDLARQKETAWPYRFDRGRAERICRFLEMCRHIKGPRRGTRITLEPWQSFILTTVFGWVHKQTGARRFRRAYQEVPRGNAKSTFSSGVGLYMLSMDGEGGAEIYSAATTRDQSKIVFGVAQAMARSMREFREKAGVEVTANSIHQLSSASFFRALSSEANTLDGLNVHLGILDELHAHKTREVYDVLETATGKREQALLWMITTSGSNLGGVCFDIRSYVLKVLERVLEDESLFGIVYTIDDDDDPFAESSFIKANPNWGVSVFPDDLRQKAKKAMQLPSAQAAFKTKHLDIWVNADQAWMDMIKWEKCSDANLSEMEFEGTPCIIGLDLASKLDLLALMKVFWRDLGDPETKQVKRHYYIFGTYWIPEARVELSQSAQYAGWVADGRLQTCRGETNDYDLVEEAIRDTAKRFQVLKVAVDPYQAVELTNHLGEEGLVMVEVPQVARHLSGPMKEIEAAVYDRRLHHDGDPVLRWAVSNVVCHRDRNDNFFPNKERFENKIDPATALMTALNQVMTEPLTQSSAEIQVW